MKLNRNDYKFNDPRICHVTPRHLELDRVLINLYMLLKNNGRRPVGRTGRIEVTMDYMVEQLVEQHANSLLGFGDLKDVVHDWVYSDLVDIVNRGIPDKEKVAAPLPLHLNAYKLRNPKYATDSRAAEHLYSMIRAGDPTLITRLTDFLGQGMDTEQDTYDEETPLDLDTLVVVRMVDNKHLKESKSSRGSTPKAPLCTGQARLLCDDLRRLLAYENVVPRSVLIDYIRTVCGLHLALYLLRIFRQLAGWVHQKAADTSCLDCPVHPKAEKHPFHKCPYAFQNQQAVEMPLPELVVDMGEDYTSHMAQLSRSNCETHYASINEYIRSVFTVNQLFRFADGHAGRRHLSSPPRTVADALQILAEPTEGIDHYFGEHIDTILPPHELEDERPEVKAIRDMEGLTPLEKFIELVALERTRFQRRYMIKLLDSVFMKNSDHCLLRQGKGKRNQRRWHIGSRLLEMLVQIAVLTPTGFGASAGFRAQPILIDEFVSWLRERYGLVIVPDWPNATIQDYEAFNGNLGNLKKRLREIGFYTDLSDAYNTQRIRPRYTIGTS